VGRAGLEPATKCLKGACSTIELTTRDLLPEEGKQAPGETDAGSRVPEPSSWVSYARHKIRSKQIKRFPEAKLLRQPGISSENSALRI
jgi:hypothetical protein